MSPRLKFVLVPMGSAGDVHPMIGIGRLLQSRGHEVIMVVQACVAFFAERAGLPHVTVGNEEAQLEVIRNPDIWHPRRAFPLLARYMPLYAKEMLPALEQQIDPGRTIIIGGTIAFAARLLAERDGVPMISMHLQPSIMMSADDPPVMVAGMEWFRKVPRFARRILFRIANAQVDRTFGKPLHDLRHAVGLPGPSPRGIMRHWVHGPDGALCLFPDWFAPKAADWAPHAVTTRFPLYDETEVLTPDPASEAFLAAGPPPVIITPGSANAHAAAFLQEAAAACVRLNRRAMLLTRFPEQAPKNLPATIKTFEYIPFGRVFPRAAAVIHHGGIGTTAQCLAAGVPQLIMPLAHDQPDNAARIKRFGVGDYLYPKAFKAQRVAQRLAALIDDEKVHQACAQYRERIRGQMTSIQFAELIETMAQRALRKSSPHDNTPQPDTPRSSPCTVHSNAGIAPAGTDSP